MTGNASRIAFFTLVTTFGAALEDLLPNFFGVGFPVLLAAVQFAAPRRSVLFVFFLAIVAGAIEESLSSLVPMTCVSFFLAAALLARHLGQPFAMTVLTYPILQVWLAVWTPEMGGGVFNRIVLAIPIGLVTALAVGALVDALGRRAAIDARG